MSARAVIWPAEAERLLLEWIDANKGAEGGCLGVPQAKDWRARALAHIKGTIPESSFKNSVEEKHIANKIASIVKHHLLPGHNGAITLYQLGTDSIDWEKLLKSKIKDAYSYDEITRLIAAPSEKIPEASKRKRSRIPPSNQQLETNQDASLAERAQGEEDDNSAQAESSSSSLSEPESDGLCDDAEYAPLERRKLLKRTLSSLAPEAVTGTSSDGLAGPLKFVRRRSDFEAPLINPVPPEQYEEVEDTIVVDFPHLRESGTPERLETFMADTAEDISVPTRLVFTTQLAISRATRRLCKSLNVNEMQMIILDPDLEYAAALKGLLSDLLNVTLEHSLPARISQFMAMQSDLQVSLATFLEAVAMNAVIKWALNVQVYEGSDFSGIGNGTLQAVVDKIWRPAGRIQFEKLYRRTYIAMNFQPDIPLKAGVMAGRFQSIIACLIPPRIEKLVDHALFENLVRRHCDADTAAADISLEEERIAQEAHREYRQDFTAIFTKGLQWRANFEMAQNGEYCFEMPRFGEIWDIKPTFSKHPGGARKIRLGLLPSVSRTVQESIFEEPGPWQVLFGGACI